MSTPELMQSGGEIEESKQASMPQRTDDPQPTADESDIEAADEETHDSFWQPDSAYADADADAVVEEYGDAVDESAEAVELEAEEVLMDESCPPAAGDLTAAFFSELSAAQDSASRARKRRRGIDSDADSDEEYGLHQRRAFHIPAHIVARYDPHAVPQSAEEYLLQVRIQADACPMVTRSSIDPRSFEHRQTSYMPHLVKASRPTNQACIPTPEWTNRFACQFAEARQSLLCFAAQHNHLRKGRQGQGWPARNDYPAWVTYCLGRDASPNTPAQRPSCPSLALVVALEQVECKGILMQMLSHGAEEITRRQKRVEKLAKVKAEKDAAGDDDLAPIDAGAATSSSPPVDASSPFPSHAYTMWLYTLLLKIDKPISDALAGDLRHCYRAVSWMRAHVNQPAHDTVKYCNMIMTMCEQFGQQVEMMKE
jgi:hypothetical protein